MRIGTKLGPLITAGVAVFGDWASKKQPKHPQEYRQICRDLRQIAVMEEKIRIRQKPRPGQNFRQKFFPTNDLPKRRARVCDCASSTNRCNILSALYLRRYPQILIASFHSLIERLIAPLSNVLFLLEL